VRRLVGLVLLASIVGGCGDDDGGTEVDGLPIVEGAPEVRVEAIDFAFVPTELTLTAAAPANIVVFSTEGGHNLVVEAVGFQLPIVDEGELTRGALTIDEPGTYEFICSVPGHLAQGMRGTIVVG
jgi:plastocyanin